MVYIQLYWDNIFLVCLHLIDQPRKWHNQSCLDISNHNFVRRKLCLQKRWFQECSILSILWDQWTHIVDLFQTSTLSIMDLWSSRCCIFLRFLDQTLGYEDWCLNRSCLFRSRLALLGSSSTQFRHCKGSWCLLLCTCHVRWISDWTVRCEYMC